jgi:uncharacterized damage-inducible protein DinB
MYGKLVHFQKTWAYESAQTSKMLRMLTDSSLMQAVTAEDRTLGRIAWHLTTAIPEMMGRAGLKLAGPRPDAPLPHTAKEIADGYDQVAKSLAEEIARSWNDESLQVADKMYGEAWKRGYTLFALVAHQTHHRGQMTVLMRQAGLKVLGVYGPAREDWEGMGARPPVI